MWNLFLCCCWEWSWVKWIITKMSWWKKRIQWQKTFNIKKVWTLSLLSQMKKNINITTNSRHYKQNKYHDNKQNEKHKKYYDKEKTKKKIKKRQKKWQKMVSNDGKFGENKWNYECITNNGKLRKLLSLFRKFLHNSLISPKKCNVIGFLRIIHGVCRKEMKKATWETFVRLS